MDFRRLFDLFHYQAANYPKKKALSHKIGDDWVSYSTYQCIEIINQLSAGFLDLGLRKGEKVAILVHKGNPIWNFVDLALQQIGVVVVPIQPTVKNEHLIFILRDSDSKVCFVSNQEMFNRIESIKGNILGLKKIFSFEKLANIPHWEILKTRPLENHLAKFETFKGAIHEDDLATIVYTAGTTGMPKGVMLSHKNIISNVKSIVNLIPVNCDSRVVSFLPLSHIFERVMTYSYMALGASIYYSNRGKEVIESMKEIRPHFFSSVPQFLKHFYDFLFEKGMQKDKLNRKILQWAIVLGESYPKKGIWYSIQLSLANRLVFRFWRRILGNNIRGILIGVTSMPAKLGRLFSAAGIPVREGYGLTETASVIALNRFEKGRCQFGTVGIPVLNTEIKIHEPNEFGEGDIWIKSPSVMKGYHNRSKEVLRGEWLKTGDIGQILENGFLQISGRKKETFKTLSGKYIIPQRIENQLKTSSYISRCLIIGLHRPYLTALIVPSFEILKDWCFENKVYWTEPRYMIMNPEVKAFYRAIVDECNKQQLRDQKIEKFTLLAEDWVKEQEIFSKDNLEKSRLSIQKIKEKEIERMYQE